MRKYSYGVIRVRYDGFDGRSRAMFLEDTLNDITKNGARIVGVTEDTYTAAGMSTFVGWNVIVEKEV